LSVNVEALEITKNFSYLYFCFGEIAGKYAVEVRTLVLRLLAAISEALGFDSDYLNILFGKHSQSMAIIYYPPCPSPDLTIGAPGHSDVGGITVLTQSDVSGLQVLRNGEWVAVEPIPNAFVINSGDQLKVSNKGTSSQQFVVFRICLIFYYSHFTNGFSRVYNLWI
jgi:isopenicillin N synthase-like dioxygenase